MGMDADIIAIGKFKKELAPYLDYPENYYEDTPEGAEIITHLFECVTTLQSKELAEAFDIHPWKFEECHLNLKFKNSNFENWIENPTHKLYKLEWAQIPDLTSFEKLLEANFNFYYRPNG